MLNYLLAPVLIFLLLIGWLWVQQLARQFAQRHPQFGPAKEEGGGCGKSFKCSAGTCKRKNPQKQTSIVFHKDNFTMKSMKDAKDKELRALRVLRGEI